MGRVAAPYGVQGWLKVQPFTEKVDALLGYPTWWLTGRGEVTPHRLLEGREHSGVLIARLEGIASREDAAAWRGVDVSVPREALPEVEDNEVYWYDLVGLTVVNRRGELLGTVKSVEDNGAHPILRVTGVEGGERLIPMVAAFVEGVDLEANRIDVDWQSDY